jgi:16S rRNA (cytidine1402-2'-O)-methyltransferase
MISFRLMNGTLYIVATPIGNLSDITLRAIDLLKSVRYIACEDTRMTGRLLGHIEAHQNPMLISYYEETEERRIPNILNLLQNGESVALVSDSGTPLISDPGYKLVRECLKLGIRVESIPGPSAAISALVSSGLPTDKFIFLGFLPRKEGNKKKLLENIKTSNEKLEATVIIYEAPHRLAKSLQSLLDVLGDMEIVVARELTKVHEEVAKGTVSEFLSKYTGVHPKGEFVILFNPKVV